MNNFIEHQPDFRKKSILTLLGYLTNPGRFSVLILGARGTGKSHWLSEISKHYKCNDCLSEIVSVNGWIVKDFNEKDWELIFEKANGKILVIDEVEQLSKSTQAILFEFLSTTDGKYGWEEKKYQCRLVFTSTFDIKTLRDNENHLLHKFFDRISQLVVSFHSFSEMNSSICEDFINTWRKMGFPDNEIPKRDFDTWLRTYSNRFHGNFRDLDKLAINWRNYQLLGINNSEILGMVVEDFFSIYHFPEHNQENKNAFYLSEDMDYYNDLLPKFRRFVREYAKRKYVRLSKAPEGAPFGVPYRTMERW